MINIMYLVLTALLALNVSAEVFNAFKIVDKGLIKSNKALDQSNEGMIEGIKDAAKTKASLATYAERIEPIRNESKQLTNYLQGIVDEMIDDKDADGNVTGGYIEDPTTGLQKLKKEKDYGVTTRILVMDPQGNPGKGEEIKSKLLEFRESMMKYVDKEDHTAFAREIAVQIDDDTWKQKDKASWSHMNFDHMPLQAVIPIFSKYINDVKATESAALNYLAGKVGSGGATVVLDKYQVVSAPKKSYIIKGEKYEADLFLSASAGGDSNTGIRISVNGKNLPLNSDGQASYSTVANSNGEKSYKATASLTDPVTGETKSFTKTFSYEVGERSVAVSASKMNVFYIGVDNPIEVSAAGVASSEVKVSMSGAGGGKVKPDGKGGYIVNVSSPTKNGEFANINVTAPGLQDKKQFRVKRIPNPVPKLSGKRGGSMPNGQFKAQLGINPDLEGFDFDARCTIAGFRLVRVAKRQDAEPADNPGGKFKGAAAALIKKAKPSDKYFFENIKCKCPGDKAARDLGTMVFNVK
jgi:gliding motility-associated protein GldM